MLRLIPFENNVAEIRVEYIGGQVLDPSSSSRIEKMCVGGGGVSAPDDLRDANTIFKIFKTLQTVHYLSSYRFELGLR